MTVPDENGPNSQPDRSVRPARTVAPPGRTAWPPRPSDLRPGSRSWARRKGAHPWQQPTYLHFNRPAVTRLWRDASPGADSRTDDQIHLIVKAVGCLDGQREGPGGGDRKIRRHHHVELIEPGVQGGEPGVGNRCGQAADQDIDRRRSLVQRVDTSRRAIRYRRVHRAKPGE